LTSVSGESTVVYPGGMAVDVFEDAAGSCAFPGWDRDTFGTLTLTVVIAGERIRLATVTTDPDTGLYETYIGLPVSGNQIGRHDSSQERAVRKAEDYLLQRLWALI
jgi:hypothetical protein